MTVGGKPITATLTFHHEPFKRPLGGDGRQLTLGTDGRGMPSAHLI